MPDTGYYDFWSAETGATMPSHLVPYGDAGRSIVETSGAEGGKELRLSRITGGTVPRGVILTDIGYVTNKSPVRLRVGARLSGNGVGGLFVYSSWDVLEGRVYMSLGSDTISVGRRQTTVGTFNHNLNLANTGASFVLLFETTNAAIRAKVWLKGQPEPESWMLDVGNITGEGDWDQPFLAVSSTTSAVTFFDWYSWGLNGQSAPLAPFEGGAPGLDTPTGLTATSITTDSATLGWTGTAPNYDLEWRPVAGSTTAVNGLSTNSYNLTGLDPATSYEFRVRAVDGAQTSDWTSWYPFETEALPAMPAPTNLRVSNLTTTSARLEWDYD